MSVKNGAGTGGDPPPEEVRTNTEAALKQVMAAAEIAQGMRRLLLADHSRHRVAPMELGTWCEGALPELAARDARQRIDAVRRRHKTALDVYAQATFAGALAATGNCDVAAQSLLDLACLHVHLGNPENALRLIDVADAEDVSQRIHELLARTRASITEYARHQLDTRESHADHHEYEEQNR